MRKQDDVRVGKVRDREPPRQAEADAADTDSLLDDLRRAMRDAPSGDVRDRISALIKQLAIVKTAKVKLKVRLDNLRTEVESEMEEMHDGGLRQLIGRYMDATDDYHFYDYNEHQVIYAFITEDLLPKVTDAIQEVDDDDDGGVIIGEPIDDGRRRGDRTSADGRARSGRKPTEREADGRKPAGKKDAEELDEDIPLPASGDDGSDDDDGDGSDDEKTERGLVKDAVPEKPKPGRPPKYEFVDEDRPPKRKYKSPYPDPWAHEKEREKAGPVDEVPAPPQPAGREADGRPQPAVEKPQAPWNDDVKLHIARYREFTDEMTTVKGRASKRFRERELVKLIADEFDTLIRLTKDPRCKDEAKAKALIGRYIGASLDGLDDMVDDAKGDASRGR